MNILIIAGSILLAIIGLALLGVGITTALLDNVKDNLDSMI
jgi:hypothetical protein